MKAMVTIHLYTHTRIHTFIHTAKRDQVAKENGHEKKSNEKTTNESNGHFGHATKKDEKNNSKSNESNGDLWSLLPARAVR